MGVVDDLMDEFTALAEARAPWEVYWRNIAMYVLPQTEGFDRMFAQHQDLAVTSVVSTPVASQKSKDLYDMTSLWAIERLTAGMLSLKTPESETWHNMGLDSYFGEEPTREEDLALERLRNYLFKVRSNPRSGFWNAHRSALRSMCGFGDGWMFIKEMHGTGPRVPYRYEWMPLSELYPAVGPDGRPNRMFRMFKWSAEQLATEFGVDKLSAKVKTALDKPSKKHDRFSVIHAVRPRADGDRKSIGVGSGSFQSFYFMPDEKHLIGEGGYYEFPFVRYAWSNTGTKPYSEGPVAYAIGELKSLQEMAKNELIATQTALRPAYGTAGKNYVRMNFNPGASNPNMVTPEGKPLFIPLNTGVRPDFAQAVLEARRGSVREMLYLNLWQIILQNKTDTATAALIKAQEKGEMLGPVGISMNDGLSMMNDREIAILSRKRAFDDGSPLAMPDSMADKNVSPIFNSPLDRLRRMSEVVGMQRLVEFTMMIEQVRPGAAARLDPDEMLDVAQDVLGAPVGALRPKESAEDERGSMGQMQQVMAMLEAVKGGGEAAKAVGEGGAAMAQGAESAVGSPALGRMVQAAPEIGAQAARGL